MAFIRSKEAEVAKDHRGRKDQGGMMSGGEKKELPIRSSRNSATAMSRCSARCRRCPAARFAFSGEMNPEFLRDAERLRGKAFYNKTFDMKTTQLILFGMLLVEHNQIAAQAHARRPAAPAQAGKSCTR